MPLNKAVGISPKENCVDAQISFDCSIRSVGISLVKHDCKAEVPEDASIGSLIGMLPLKRYPFANATYTELYGSWNGNKESFGIDADGYLVLEQTLDREVTDAYHLYVFTEARASPDDVRSDEIKIDIRVTDANDNPHSIKCPKELLLMPQHFDVDAVVCNFDVRDIDAAPPRGLRTSLHGPDAVFFLVQDVSPPQRYALSAASKPEPEKDIYVVTIVAEDDANFTAHCSVQIAAQHYLADVFYELLMMGWKFFAAHSFDTRPHFAYCPSTHLVDKTVILSGEVMLAVSAEAYLSRPDVNISGQRFDRFKLVAYEEPECAPYWHCLNYIVVAKRAVNTAFLKELEIQLDISAAFGGRTNETCRILLHAPGENASLEAPAKPLPPVAAVNERWTTAQLIVAVLLASVISVAGYMAFAKLRRFRRLSAHRRGAHLKTATSEFELKQDPERASTSTELTSMDDGAAA